MKIPTVDRRPQYQGILRNQSATDYHSAAGLNSTKIRNLLTSVQYASYRETMPETTKSLSMGEAVHTAILEPMRFKREYVRGPNARKGSKEHSGFLAANANKTILTPKEYDDCVGMDLAVQNHPTAGPMIRDATQDDIEVSVYSEMQSVPVRCRCDVLLGNTIIDVKSTKDASPEGFARAIAMHGYHIQAAFYRMVLMTRHEIDSVGPFRFIAVQKTAPYLVGVYELDQESLDHGFKQVNRAIQRFKENRESDSLRLKQTHDGYGAGVKTISIPQWKINQEATNE